MPIPQTVRNARDAATLAREALLAEPVDEELTAVLRVIGPLAAKGHLCLTDHPIPARVRVRLVQELHALRFEAWAQLPSPESSRARLNVSWPESPGALDD